MSRSRFMKGFIAGLGLTMLLSTAAFAEEQAVSPDMPVSSSVITGTAQVVPGMVPAALGSAQTGSGTAPAAVDAMPVSALDPVSDEMYNKQSEIDKYLFDEHKDEIAAKGITITHTAAGKDCVEVGITPFTKENADFIYKALGTDQIKVVEGTQAIAYSTGAANGEEGLMYATGAPAEEAIDGAAQTDVKAVSAPADAQLYTATAGTASAQNGTTLSAASVPAIAAAVLVLLAGILYSARRLRTAKR